MKTTDQWVVVGVLVVLVGLAAVLIPVMLPGPCRSVLGCLGYTVVTLIGFFLVPIISPILINIFSRRPPPE